MVRQWHDGERKPTPTRPRLELRELDLLLHAGAGDENRTRTISLGSLWRCTLVTWGLADLRVCRYVVRETPRLPVVTLPFGHIAGTPWPTRMPGAADRASVAGHLLPRCELCLLRLTSVCWREPALADVACLCLWVPQPYTCRMTGNASSIVATGTISMSIQG